MPDWEERMSPTFMSRFAALHLGALIAASLGSLPAIAGEAGLYQRSGGVEAYIGFVPAEITKGHAPTKPDKRMHDQVPRGGHQYHLVAAVFDVNTGERISDASVTAQVSGLGLVGPEKSLEPMRIAGTITYGAYFELPGADRYKVVLTIRRADATKPVTLNFTYDHRNP
jgi:hypothetical protein